MTGRLFVRNVDGDMEEVPTFPSEGWTVEESAEEGNASSSAVDIPDPDMEYDFYSLRRAIVYEDESESDDQVLFSGFIGPHEVGRSVGKFVEPLARTWSVSLDDMNSLWGNRVLVGSDTDRPDETDVERMTWLVATEEMGYFDNLDWLFTDDPEDLDERDVARQSVKSVADESSQQSGKNYWIGATGNVTDGTDIFVWYGNDSHEEYSSLLRLSNVPGDWDTDELAAGTSLTWPVSFDTKLARTGERIYDGVVVEYENGAEYVKNTATTALFTLSGRDLVHPAPEIKTGARAIRRAQRLLADLDSMDEVLTCTVELPNTKATMIRAGMRISVRASHIPGWEDFGWARVMKCSVSPMHGGTHYALTLTLQGPTSFIADDCSVVSWNYLTQTIDGSVITGNTPSGSYPPHSVFGLSGNDLTYGIEEGLSKYTGSGGGAGWFGARPYPQPTATLGIGGGWSFRNYNVADGSMPFGVKDGGTVVAAHDKLQLLVVGAGTMTAWATSVSTGGYRLYGVDIPDPLNWADDVLTLLDSGSLSFPSTDIVVPDAGYCLYSIIIVDDSGDGASLFWGGFDWAAA